MGKGSTILNANEDNRLLEFTATIDLENKMSMKNTKIRYIALDRFIQDKYSECKANSVE